MGKSGDDAKTSESGGNGDESGGNGETDAKTE
jgi:hypothetical protein